ncbi:MAG: multidrug efflux SMR transporter [Candidatus Latescibacteria bacterium]|jgi:quaternary ammonium compound-resistance protein SugE|nr:multidrug efflux SMR transporter [Candidatus Latescibacterota bacterium]
MAWALLVVAVVLEVIWAVSLKATQGYTQLRPTIVNVVALVLNLYVLAVVFKHLPMGTAYAVWTGLGAAGIVVFGIVYYGEAASAPRLACIGLIVAGVVGLKVVSGE